MINFDDAVAVNAAINKLPYRSDAERYGSPEFWTEIDALGGDCEDFALAKRRDLLALGADRSCLHLAQCMTEGGEFHAVLIVNTDRGDYVLDNRYPDPMARQDLGYLFISMQVGNEWRKL